LIFSPLQAFGFVEVAPEADKKELCPSLKYLFKDTKMERYQIFENTSTFCPEIEKTCCTKQDFIALSNWWQTNKVNGSTCSRQAIRQQNTHSIIYYTKMILKKFDNYKHLATKIGKSHGSSEFCQLAAKNFLGNLNTKLVTDKKFLNEFFTKQTSCFELTNKLQLNVLCGTCDPTYNKTVDFETGKVRLNKQACTDISKKCSQTISSNLNVIYPFLRYLEPLMRCSPEGDYMSALKKINFSSKHTIDHAIKDELSISQCEKAITFGVKMNYNSEGNPNFLRKLYRRAKRYFDLKEQDRRAEQQSEINSFMDRRRLKVRNSKKNLDELFGALNKKKLLKILSNGSQDDEDDFINDKNWSTNLIKHMKTKEDGGFKFSSWLEFKIKGMKYPYKQNAFDEFLGLCKFELKGYFERNYVLLLLAEEKSKILKTFKELKFETFKKEYGCSRFAGKFISIIDSLHNEHINYTDHLKKIIRNYPCPKTKKPFENMMELFKESIESVYAFKRRNIIMSNEQYKIETYLSNLDFAKFKSAYKKKKTFVKDFAKVIAKFSFKQGNLLQLEELLSDRLLNKRSYPDDAEEFKILIEFVNDTIVSYFKLKSTELNTNYHQNVVIGYLKSMDYNKFKKEFNEEKTFVEDIYNEIKSQMALSDKDIADNLAKIVKYRLSYSRYPNTMLKYKAFSKEWLKIVANYFDRIKLDMNLVYDKTMTALYIKKVDIEQFHNSYETEDFHVSLSNYIKKFFEKNDASDLKDTLQKTFKKVDYPKNSTQLNAIKDTMTDKLDSFFKSTEDVMMNEYCRKDLIDLFESVDYVEFQYKFNGHKSTFGDQLLESLQKYCGVYNRNKKELMLKISNELKYPTDEEDFYQMVAKIKKRVKDVYNTSGGRRLVNLLLNQMKIAEQEQTEKLKKISALRQRVLQQAKSITKESRLKRLIKLNQKLERMLKLEKKGDFVDIDTKKTAAKPSKKAKMDDSDRLYKKEELEELKHMPRKNSSRDKPRSAAKKEEDESDDEESEADKKSTKGEETKVKRSECLDEIEDEITNYTRTKFEDENPNSDDVQAIFSSFISKISGCGNWLKKEDTIEDILQDIKLKLPTYKKSQTSTEKDSLFNEKIKQALIKAKEKFVKKESEAKAAIRRMKATDRKMNQKSATNFVTEDKYQVHDDHQYIIEGFSKTGRIAYFAKPNIKAEMNKNVKLMRQLKKSNGKILPIKELEKIRRLAKENKDQCKNMLEGSINNLDIKHWRELRKNCDTSDCAIIKFLDSQRKKCNGYLRSIRELRYVTPDLEIVYSSTKYTTDQKKNLVMNSKVKKILVDQVERFLCDERVRKDGSLLKDSQDVQRRVLEKLKRQYEQKHL